MELYKNPKIQKFDIEGVNFISVDDAFRLISENNVHFLDIRENHEVAREYFDFRNIFFFPLSEIMEKLGHLPQNIDIIVVSNNGIRATKVVNMLNRQGYKSVANMDGGITEWKNKGLPIIETGFDNDAPGCDCSGCGCGCSECH